jgi:hypothetical protein
MFLYARTLPCPAFHAFPNLAPAFVADLSASAASRPVLQSAGGGILQALMTGGIPSLFRHPPPLILAEDLAGSALALLAAVYFAGFCIEHSWQDSFPLVKCPNWLRRYSALLDGLRFDPKLRRVLEWNPIAWLQEYSWKSRENKWRHCLIFILLVCAFLDGKKPAASALLLALFFLILPAAYTFAGVNGFFLEKKNGALELILVSPLTAKQIVFGRGWGFGGSSCHPSWCWSPRKSFCAWR